MPKKSDFQQTALFENEVAVPRSNPSNNTILPAQIAQNTNLSDIFFFEFEANKSPFLFSNTVVNEQKAITAMYTEAKIEEKQIQLILDSRLARNMLPEKYNWIDVAMKEKVCDQTCQYALSISKKVKKETLFDTTYNSALNKLYHYSYDAEIIFDLVIALINGAIQKNVCQMKEAEYIEYTIELAKFNYEDEVETYHQIASHIYLT
ncbi:hypothetical protein G9A89_012677 [Geosiphon pyriformis]|nr:hypothetical protein G9A89_012677 [Geosiphon pyriformis]